MEDCTPGLSVLPKTPALPSPAIGPHILPPLLPPFSTTFITHPIHTPGLLEPGGGSSGGGCHRGDICRFAHVALSDIPGGESALAILASAHQLSLPQPKQQQKQKLGQQPGETAATEEVSTSAAAAAPAPKEQGHNGNGNGHGHHKFKAWFNAGGDDGNGGSILPSPARMVRSVSSSSTQVRTRWHHAVDAARSCFFRAFPHAVWDLDATRS